MAKFPKQDEALKRLGPHHIIHEHDDGDLTVESRGIRYVVTTEGSIFREEYTKPMVPDKEELKLRIQLEKDPNKRMIYRSMLRDLEGKGNPGAISKAPAIPEVTGEEAYLRNLTKTASDDILQEQLRISQTNARMTSRSLAQREHDKLIVKVTKDEIERRKIALPKAETGNPKITGRMSTIMPTDIEGEYRLDIGEQVRVRPPVKLSKVRKLVDDVPDIDDPAEINYWVTEVDRQVYLEGWADTCLAGTGFPTMEEGGTTGKINYMVDLTPEILQRKAKERGLTLVDGGFIELPDADNLYGVTWGVYSKAPVANPKAEVGIAPKTSPNPGNPDTVEHQMDVWLLLHSIPAAHGSPGIVVDADVAARTPCTVYSIDGSEIVFSKGIIGALDKAQKEAYCPTKEYKKSPGIEKRLRNWQEAVNICKTEIADIPKGERLEPWLSCMGRELPKKGIEI